MIADSLYVHIPFCKHICAYCDFAKVFYHETWADEYLNQLEKELNQRQANRSFKTVYIGGGSPSALNEKQLARLFEILKKPLSQTKEATMEINPEDLTLKKAQLMKKAGINRVSMGVQTFNEDLLKILGRHHTLSDIYQAIRWLNEVGIERLSFDFIYGLPHQTLHDLKKDLEMLEEYPQVSHLSFYTLILEEHTKFYADHIDLMEDDWLLDAQKLIIEKLNALGFERYEVSNFAKEDQQSLHNLVYWHNQRYVGIGCGASGYIENTRYDNTKSIQHYLQGETTLHSTTLTKEEQMFETLMVGLRLTQGISLIAFEETYHVSLMTIYREKLQTYLDMDLLEIKDGYLRTTPKGMDVLDEILVNLME